MTRIAAFVSPHGFGHAARASAVLGEANRRAEASFELFTTAPEWFFRESLDGLFRLHRVQVDVGFRQRSALHVDLPATVEALHSFLPVEPGRVESLAATVRRTGCTAVLCDIAPLGVAVAEAAGVPSLLVENFSWGWLYEPLAGEAPELGGYGAILDGLAARATAHLQARPVCAPKPGLEQVAPIGRPPRRERGETRHALGIPEDVSLVVVTMGGYGEGLPFLDELRTRDDLHFLVTGAGGTGREGNLHLFDNDTPLYMPDILRAADGVVAKLGYGTVAEVWREGLPFAQVTRPGFREMASLESFAADELTGFCMDAGAFAEGTWIPRLEELLSMPRRPHGCGGAHRAAEVLLELAG